MEDFIEDDEKQDFPPRQKLHVWAWIACAIGYAMLLISIVFYYSGRADAAETPWQIIPADKCISLIMALPIVYETFNKTGMSGPIRGKIIRQKGRKAIVSYRRAAAGFVFQFRWRANPFTCLDGWRTVKEEEAHHTSSSSNQRSSSSGLTRGSSATSAEGSI